MAEILDPHFEQIVTPVLSEYGYSGGIKQLALDQLGLMLQSKIDHYEAEMAVYSIRLGCSYEQAVERNATEGDEGFALDDLLDDWRFAREAAAHYQAKLDSLNRA